MLALTSIHLCASEKASSQLTVDCWRHSITNDPKRDLSCTGGPQLNSSDINVGQSKQARTVNALKTGQAETYKTLLIGEICLLLFLISTTWSQHGYKVCDGFPSHHAAAAAYLFFHPSHLRFLLLHIQTSLLSRPVLTSSKAGTATLSQSLRSWTLWWKEVEGFPKRGPGTVHWPLSGFQVNTSFCKGLFIRISLLPVQ